MNSRYHINTIVDVNVSGGYLIDGFPSTGHTSAIASASLIQAMKFALVATIDSDRFPPVSLIYETRPFHPTRIFASEQHKTAVFSSYLALPITEHKSTARLMLRWAREHGVSHIISSIAINAKIPEGKIIAAGSTDDARKKIIAAGMEVMSTGIITGIPGSLLNYGSLANQNVIVVVFNPTTKGPDFKSSAMLCGAMSKLVPGISCDITTLQNEAQLAEKSMRETRDETGEGVLKKGMYG